MTGFKVDDRGQRYEVRAKNEIGYQVVIGWAEAKEGVAALVKSVELHPSFHSPLIFDRRKDVCRDCHNKCRVIDRQAKQ